MNLIEKNKQLTDFIKSGPVLTLLVPVWSSPKAHEWGNRISFIYYRTADSDGIINFNHIDAAKIDKIPDFTKITDADTLVYGIRYLQAVNGLDLEWVWFETNKTPFIFGEFVESVYRGYRNEFKQLNDCIPLMKWYEKLKELPDITERRESDKLYTSAIRQLGRLEGAGVAVDEEKFIDRYNFNPEYIHRHKAYTKYNPYTITGRPSNRHLGVNWSAMPKEDGSRQSVITRYSAQGGSLIQMDWESYHVRLIARIVGYEFPEGVTAHGHLAEYYGVTEAESKGITFTYLYGGITDAVKDIPFYRKVGEWLDGMWNGFVISGVLTTPIFKRQIHFSRIEGSTKQKVFNYLLQALETEINYKKLAEILAVMEGKMSKPVLYTYDSLLIDTHPIEREWVLTTLRTVMERGGFPVRAYEGNNYNDLEVIP
jgi:hypothetical protein